MATDTTLSTVNVFESTTSYNNNSGSVGANELSLVKIPAVLIETYRSGSSWYRKWSDGFIEQGGELTVTHEKEVTLSFHTAFTSTDYCLSYIVDRNASTSPSHTDDMCLTITWAAIASMGLYPYDAGDNGYTTKVRWKVCGY